MLFGKMRIHHLLSIIILVIPYSFALEATFTPNPADSPENGGSGPLPQSMEQRKQLLELSVAIAQTPDPASTLSHVAQQNGITADELGAMLDRNTKDLQESGQLEEMLQGVQANLAAQSAGRGASGTLPRRAIGLFSSVIMGITKGAASQIAKHPKHSSIFATAVILSALMMHNIPKNGLAISSGTSPISRGHSTLLNPPIEYAQNFYLDAWVKGKWESSLPEPVKAKKSKAKKQSNGGVGMTRYVKNNYSETRDDDVCITTELDRDELSLVTTASQTISIQGCLGNGQDVDEDNGLDEAMEIMLESISTLFDDRKFSEYTLAKSALKWRSVVVADGENDALEGAVMTMRLLGDFGRYGIQPFCHSYELDEENANDSTMIRCVAFHTLKGGHFDGELKFSVNSRDDNSGVVISVTLAIPQGGRSPPIRLAESMVKSLTSSIIRSSQLRIKQTSSRRNQSKHYRARSAARAKEKRHLKYEQEKLQEEMAAERKRKWKRNNPDAGHYRPSGHRLRGPGGSPNFVS